MTDTKYLIYRADMDRHAAIDMLTRTTPLNRRDVAHLLNEANSRAFVINRQMDISCNAAGLFTVGIKVYS